MPAHQFEQLGLLQAQQQGILLGRYRGATRLGVDSCHLTKDIALAQVRQRLMAIMNPDLTGQDGVQLCA